jgi:nicotinamidase-related amidase
MRRRAVLEIHTPKTALLLLHFQNDNVDPKGKFGATVRAAVFENATRAANAARRVGVSVIHVRIAFRPGYPGIDGTSTPILQSVKRASALLDDTWGVDFHPAVAPVQGDLVVTQGGMSVLAGTELRTLLPARGITTLVLAGVSTNVVITGTVWEAALGGYRAIVLADGCAADTDEAHAVGLRFLSPLATIVTTEEFLAGL